MENEEITTLINEHNVLVGKQEKLNKQRIALQKKIFDIENTLFEAKKENYKRLLGKFLLYESFERSDGKEINKEYDNDFFHEGMLVKEVETNYTGDGVKLKGIGFYFSKYGLFSVYQKHDVFIYKNTIKKVVTKEEFVKLFNNLNEEAHKNFLKELSKPINKKQEILMEKICEDE